MGERKPAYAQGLLVKCDKVAPRLVVTVRGAHDQASALVRVERRNKGAEDLDGRFAVKQATNVQEDERVFMAARIPNQCIDLSVCTSVD